MSAVGSSIRECGSCFACCTVIGVHELDKRMYETCEHVCEAGCGIYAERPVSCRTFACQWLRGLLEINGGNDAEMRPDACGVVFDYQPDTAFGEAFVAWEVEPGASASGHARSIIAGLEERFLVMIMAPGPDGDAGPGERSFVGPPHRVAQADDVMWSRPAETAPKPVSSIFFYGLFMDRSLLVEKGLQPVIIGPAVLRDYRIHIGQRATLLRSASSRAYGIVMDLTDQEALALYSEPSVREYIAERVQVELLDTSEAVEAYCYNLPRELGLAGANPTYATKLAQLVEALHFDSAYVEEIAAFGEVT